MKIFSIVLSFLCLFSINEVLAQNVIKDSLDATGSRIVVYTPDPGVCSKLIEIKVSKINIIESVVFTRGCDGNLKGIGALVKGMKAEDAIEKLKGIPCGRRKTSCPDQLSSALEYIISNKK